MAFSRSSLYDPSPRHTISQSLSFQKKCQLDDHFIDRLDRTEILGGEDSAGNIIGHTRCVNALSWSPSGQLLASGSDDRNVVLWKLGSEQSHIVSDTIPRRRNRSRISARVNAIASLQAPTSSNDLLAQANADADDIVKAWPQRSFPHMDLAMLGKIETGHRANIFSVKWAPNASERRLFTCAGDSHVRVFDINYMSSPSASSQIIGAEGEMHRTSTGTEYNVWSEHSGACVRLFRCHRGRAKRISTEVSPDVFLTCGEDGDVRQMDLRVPHTCRSRTGGSCPPALAHYPWVLYSLSVSKLEPWLFAVAGESSLAYLHDRRMIPRLLKREWGMEFSTDQQQDALTMCVRSFGLPPGGFDTPWAQNDGRTALVNAEPPRPNRPLLMGNRNSITACKLSEHNGRDLLVSYSSGHVYRFDIHDEPGVLQANLENARFSLDTQGRSQSPEASTSETEADKPEIDEDVDLEKGQAETRLGNTEEDENDREGNESQRLAQSIRNNDVETGIETETDMDVEQDSGDDEGDIDIEVETDSQDTDDEETEEEEEDDDDGGDLSEEDLMHLLQEEEQNLHEDSNVPTVYPRSAYKGHCNKETVKDVGFAGGADNYVVSGSDDGNWFLWDKLSSDIKGIWQGDSSVVNVMAMHPDLPVFAISGIDDTIKIFAPISVSSFPPPAVDERAREASAQTPPRQSTERTQVDIRNHKLADQLVDKEAICHRNQRALGRDLVAPAANLLWRLHPRLLGLDIEGDPERQIEGDCVVM